MFSINFILTNKQANFETRLYFLLLAILHFLPGSLECALLFWFYFTLLVWSSRFLRALLIGLSKAVKGGDGVSTLRPADDTRFTVCTFNQSDHLVLAHLGALVSRCRELVVTASHFLTEFSRRIQHDNVTEKATAIPTQYGNLSIVDWDDCGEKAWG